MPPPRPCSSPAFWRAWRDPSCGCCGRPDLFAPGLAAAGLQPDRIVFTEAGKAVLPVMEEGLRHPGLTAVVAELSGRLSLVASRRLQLAAEQTGILAILLRRSRGFDDPVLNQPTAASTSWRIAALPSPPALPHAPDTPGLGATRWRLELTRCRGGEPGSWIVEAGDATGRLGLVPDFPTDRIRRRLEQAGQGSAPRVKPEGGLARKGAVAPLIPIIKGFWGGGGRLSRCHPRVAPSSPKPLTVGSKGVGPWRGRGAAPGLDPAGRSPRLTLVTVAWDGNCRMLAAVDAAASSLGLYAGMKLAQAQALVPDLAIHEHDPKGDATALLRLAGWCLRYAPLVAVDPPDGLWIDVTGSTHLHGGETRLLHDLARRLMRPGSPRQDPTNHDYQGLAVRAAVADTPAVAHAVARFGSRPLSVVPPDAAVLNNLPIEALRLPAKLADSLRLMGFDRIGPLLVAARAPLVRRFGTQLATKLDQALGKLFEPIEPIVPLS